MNYQYKLTQFKGDMGHGVASDAVKEALVTCSLPIIVKKMDVGALVKKTLIELYTDSVFSVGIRSVFLGNYHTNTEGKLGRYFRYTYIKKVRNLQ